MATKKYTAAEEKALALELQKQLAKNTELVRVLYTLRGEAPPNNNSDDHSVMGEPHEEERPRSWEVYSAMPGIDSLHTGLSKRTPNGTHATILWHASIPAAHLSMRLPSPQAASSLRETASMCLSHGRAVSLHARSFVPSVFPVRDW